MKGGPRRGKRRGPFLCYGGLLGSDRRLIHLGRAANPGGSAAAEEGEGHPQGEEGQGRRLGYAAGGGCICAAYQDEGGPDGVLNVWLVSDVSSENSLVVAKLGGLINIPIASGENEIVIVGGAYRWQFSAKGICPHVASGSRHGTGVNRDGL